MYPITEGLIEHLKAATGDVADDLMTHLKVMVLISLSVLHVVNPEKNTEDDLIEGTRFGAAMELIEPSCNAAAVISL